MILDHSYYTYQDSVQLISVGLGGILDWSYSPVVGGGGGGVIAPYKCLMGIGI